MQQLSAACSSPQQCGCWDAGTGGFPAVPPRRALMMKFNDQNRDCHAERSEGSVSCPPPMMTFNDQSRDCHPERSEGSVSCPPPMMTFNDQHRPCRRCLSEAERSASQYFVHIADYEL